MATPLTGKLLSNDNKSKNHSNLGKLMAYTLFIKMAPLGHMKSVHMSMRQKTLFKIFYKSHDQCHCVH